MNQTTFVASETQLHAPRGLSGPLRDMDTSTWIWVLSLALIVSATINIFNYGRHYEKKSISKKP